MDRSFRQGSALGARILRLGKALHPPLKQASMLGSNPQNGGVQRERQPPADGKSPAARSHLAALLGKTCWFLGDDVGYGPDPAAALRFLREAVSPDDWVLGNHDAMLADLLTDADLQAAGAPEGIRLTTERGQTVTCRGQLLTPEEWRAVSTYRAATAKP